MIQYLKIGQAAQIIGVSINTLRRWEELGLICPIYTPRGTRLYRLDQLQNLKRKSFKSLSAAWLPKTAIVLLIIAVPTIILLQLAILKYLFIADNRNGVAESSPLLILTGQDSINGYPFANIQPETGQAVTARMTKIEQTNQQMVKELNTLRSLLQLHDAPLAGISTTSTSSGSKNYILNKNTSRFYYLSKYLLSE